MDEEDEFGRRIIETQITLIEQINADKKNN